MLDLTAIKARRNYSYGNCATPLLAAISDIDALLLEVERLQLIERVAERLDLMRDIEEHLLYTGEEA